MNRPETDEKLLREIETNILDTHHKSFEVFQYSDSAVVPFLLKAYGDVIRHNDELVKRGRSEFSLRRFYFQFISGVSQCIKWITGNRGKTIKEIPAPTPWNEMIMDFVAWGMEYYVLSQQFVGFSRGIIGVAISKTEKKIEFISPEGNDYEFLINQLSIHDEITQNIYDSLPHEVIDETFVRWFKSKEKEFSIPPIANSIDWEGNQNSSLFDLVYQYFDSHILPEVSNEFDLGGYTLQDFKKFHSSLFLSFSFICWIEMLYDKKLARQYNAFGSNPIVGEPSEVLNLLARATSMERGKCKKIVSDLTLDLNHAHSNLISQPFISISQDEIAVLPNLYSHIEPNRMLITSLTKSHKKGVYDTMINRIESYHLAKIVSHLKKNKSWDILKQPLITSEGKKYTPDILIFDVKESACLIIDYKHSLVPFSTSEVNYRLNEIRKGVVQVQNYIECLKIAKVKDITIGDYAIYGMLLFHRPMPIPMFDTGEVTLSDLHTFSTAKLGGLRDFLNETSRLQKRTKGNLEKLKLTTKVNDWSFIRTAVVSKKD